MDIRSGCGYPGAALSNFAAHPFVFDGIQVNSMEGLLQSFKFKEIEIQREICLLVGYAAKKRGKSKNWRIRQTLYWNGEGYLRADDGYQKLLDRAYLTLYQQNEGFRKALLATKEAVLTHSIGRTNTAETILTQHEFCSRLMWLKQLAKEEQEKQKV